MRGSAIAVRAALVCSAAGIGLAIWSAADDPAYASDRRPAAVELPGGVLDGGPRLPRQASDRAQQVVAQVVPHKTATPKPKADKPKPPKAQPPAAPKPHKKPVELPPVAVDVPPVIDELAPTPETEPDGSDVVTLPATDLAPLPDAEDLLTLPGVPVPPAVVPPAPVIAPETLPVMEPAPAAESPTGIVAQLVTALTAGEQDLAADCADDPRDARRVDHDAIRALLAILDGEPAPAVQRAARGHNPCDPDGPELAALIAGVAALSQRTGDQLPATAPSGPLAPALRILNQLLPRSDIPPSRTTHLDPRPA